METKKTKQLSEVKVKKLIRKTYNKELVKNNKIIKNKIYKESKNLPPDERKKFLKKLGKRFLEGAVAATGAAVAIGVVYGLSRKKIHKEVDTLTGKATDRLINDIPHATNKLKQEIESSIDPLVDKTVSKIGDKSDELIKRSVETAGTHLRNQIPGVTETAKNELNRITPDIVNKLKNEIKDSLPEITDTAANNMVDALQRKVETEETQEFIQEQVKNASRGGLGILGDWVVPKTTKTNPKTTPENKGKNLKKQVNQSNIIGELNSPRSSRSASGIPEVDFGKMKFGGKRTIKIKLKQLQFDLKKLNKIK